MGHVLWSGGGRGGAAEKVDSRTRTTQGTLGNNRYTVTLSLKVKETVENNRNINRNINRNSDDYDRNAGRPVVRYTAVIGNQWGSDQANGARVKAVTDLDTLPEKVTKLQMAF